jgi:hypothetical protein
LKPSEAANHNADPPADTATFDLRRLPKVLQLYLELQQYPVASRQVRDRMRQEIVNRGVILPDQFDREVEQKAIESQRREGITNPIYEEPSADWSDRLQIIRDQLTDFYFAHNLPHDLLKEIVQEVVNRRAPGRQVVLSFNPELAPWDLLFAQADRWKSLPPAELASVRHHIQEFVVVLIKGLISDQLAFVGIARQYFTMDDLREIRRRRIGRGKIGGKSAGMLLAWKMLQQAAQETGSETLTKNLSIPESYYLGADVFYDFVSLNELHGFMNQKYLTEEEVEAEYPRIQAAFCAGWFPPHIVQGLRHLLEEVGNAPLIVRSSSLLEDNFGYAFSGKYESYFCANQGTPDENLEALQDAIRRVYSSVLNPAALFYRRHRGVLDYDERMAGLIQKVIGKQRQEYFFPAMAGVAFSRNPHRWNPRIRPEDGFVRLVLGLGTRAVDRVANDYPRVIALSHPTLRPEIMPQQIKHYSQHFVDLIDLHENTLTTVPLAQVPLQDIQGLRFLVSVDEGDHLREMITARTDTPPDRLVLTFNQLLQKTSFISLIRQTLQLLEARYQRPVDIEFTLDMRYAYPQVELEFCLLQCRTLSSRDDREDYHVPTNVPEKDILFTANRMVPNGAVQRIEYIIYVDPGRYADIPDTATRLELGRVVGRLNRQLEGHTFILMGPGRWGTSNIELGVKVSYADIFNCRALIEVAMPRGGGRPEVSYGTHFFQDLVEAEIYPLALYPGEPGIIFDSTLLDQSPNQLSELLPGDAALSDLVRVIHVPTATGGRYLELVMNSEAEKALAYLK